MAAQKQHICIVGCDAANLRLMEECARDEPRWALHCLFEAAEVADPGTSMEVLAGEADRRCRAARITPSAMVGWWGFPVTSLTPYLSRRYRLPGPSLESVLRCEHKYWSRLEQRGIVEACPDFEAVDPFDDRALERMRLDYPFWLKPIKATGSELGFRVACPEDFRRATAAIRDGIGPYGDALDFFLEKAALPAEVAGVTGRHCIAESLIGGRQCTVSGYVAGGKARVYGVVDSLNYEGTSSFLGYIYPSDLPEAVQRRLADQSCRFMEHIGYDQAAFNIEYFYDEAADRAWLLEVNPRISQSHAKLYRDVDGLSNQRLMAELALGQAPRWPADAGDFACSGKFFVRRFSDARVTRAPRPLELDEIVEAFPGTEIHLRASEGMRLSDTTRRDSYSFAVAEVLTAGDSRDELLMRFEAISGRLRFAFEAVNDEEEADAGG